MKKRLLSEVYQWGQSSTQAGGGRFFARTGKQDFRGDTKVFCIHFFVKKVYCFLCRKMRK